MTEPRLVLLRHAKAAPPSGTADVDRPLTDRGHADAAAAGAWLARRGIQPQLVLCSPAKRTRQTWHAVAVALAHTAAPQVRYERLLYTGGTDELLTLVRQVPQEVDTVLVIGHNPTLSEFSALLDRDVAAGSDGLRTCAIAVHAPQGGWAGCTAGAARYTDGHTARG